MHPISVGFILQSAGYSEDVIIAGILHDVVEDTEYTEDDIKREFGERVAHLVLGVTEDNTIKSKQEKRQKYFEIMQKSENEIKAVCVADFLDNRRAILLDIEQGIDIWSKFSETPEQYIEDSIKKLTMITETLNDAITKEAEFVLNKIKEKLI